jgi:hypothetical protein
LAVGAETVPAPRSMIALRYLDVVVVLVAAIPALALGAPVLGYLVGGGFWILARVIAANDSRLTARLPEHRQLAARLFAPFGRIFLLAGGIVIAAVAGGRRDGLTAAIVIFAAYSMAFAIRLISGPPPARTGELR